jgi:hypothetical protein
MLNLRTLKHSPQPPRAAKAVRVYIHLGRTGDAIATLPLCLLYFKETGQKAALMVAQEFSSFLEGVSYVEPEIWTRDFKDVIGARIEAKRMGYKEIIVPQIYGHNLQVEHTESSFIRESWKRVGMLGQWGAPLVFDNRNFARECKLVARMPSDKPVILVATSGHSAPFPYRDDLFASIRKHVGTEAHVMDMADFRTEHFHDFLGVIDKAACFVTCDTGFGQLCQASETPVCALIANKPTTWHSSPPRPNHACYIRYNEYQERKGELMDAIDHCLARYHRPTIRHVWAGIGLAVDGMRRLMTASETWQREARSYGHWIDWRIHESPSLRTAQGLGDPAQLPYIHDMMDMAAVGADDKDILLLTNADICLIPGMGHEIAQKCGQVGATYCYRWDFQRVVTHIERADINKGRWYVGCDLFAVTVQWWREHRHELPPFVLGRECWDWIFRELINQTGGSQIEKGIYHEKHPSHWEINRGLAGNLHNRSYARAWLIHNGLDLAEIANEPYTKVNWPPIET